MHAAADYASSIRIEVWKSGSDPIGDVIAILREGSTKPVSVEWLQGKLSWDRGGIATIAYDGARPIGIALLGAAPFVDRGRLKTVYLSLYNFVLSDYRGLGVYNRLLRSLNEAGQAENLDLALTFPNARSRPGFEKAGWLPLSPMQAYVNVPMTANNPSRGVRLLELLKSRGHDFEPISSDGLTQHDFERLSSYQQESEDLKFSTTMAALRFRFNAVRGPWYRALHGENVSAVIRLGRRGVILECQFLMTFPRVVTSEQWRELLRIVNKRYAPHMISRMESTSQRSPFQYLSSGFFRLREVTTPYWRSFNGATSHVAPQLSGVDLHLW